MMIPAAFSTMARPPRVHNRARKLLGNTVKGPLALAGLVLAASLAIELKIARDVANDAKGDKKRVLVLPFYRMKLVETRKPSLGAILESFRDNSNDDAIMEVEVNQLVDAIHAAAQDPNVVALYGVFGHGFRFSSGGWGHCEEVRNALKVFRESHRLHREPNVTHDVRCNSDLSPKASFAYADSFANPLDSGNQEYYLASVFSHIHLQAQGECNLFGMGSSSTFAKDFLQKYGITAHVFKHGVYKNAPNMLTEHGFTREHLENVTNILESANDHICDGIAKMRGLSNFEDDPLMWRLVHDHGTFTAKEAQKMGLVDFTPPLNPLQHLLDSANNEKDEQKLGKHTDYRSFQANSAIDLPQYLSLMTKRKKISDRRWKLHYVLKSLAEKSSATSAVLQAMGFKSPYYNIDEAEYSEEKSAWANETIALVRIQGTIDDKVARETSQIFRKIKKDDNVKAVVIRVDSPGGSVTASETILQECKDLPQPVVCSMGNVAASGGYYLASNCNRIFALPNTITGSIGVFGIKLDFAKMAAQYGITRQYVSSGSFSSMYDPLCPMNKDMKLNFSRNVDRYYHYFKSIVSEGRGLDMRTVEDVAQGRVWTGQQAKVNGLVDELGGLQRAISYAQRTYTNGHAVVELWPKPKSIYERLMNVKKGTDTDSDEIVSIIGALFLALLQPDSFENADRQDFLLSSGIVLAMDENLALEYALRDARMVEKLQVPMLPANFWF